MEWRRSPGVESREKEVLSALKGVTGGLLPGTGIKSQNEGENRGEGSLIPKYRRIFVSLLTADHGGSLSKGSATEGGPPTSPSKVGEAPTRQTGWSKGPAEVVDLSRS
ncbi:hypothetical protein NL676_010836 [Syzygium grande]|nr:hypothetical protein NL676_010836 [Syzygium grande]